MQSFLVLALCVAVAVAIPVDSDKNAEVKSYVNDNIGVGQFQYGYETSNGISAQEQGQLNNAGTDAEAIAVSGRFSYQGPDGVVYTVTYTADENGFRAQGAHLPQPPQA